MLEGTACRSGATFGNLTTGDLGKGGALLTGGPLDVLVISEFEKLQGFVGKLP